MKRTLLAAYHFVDRHVIWFSLLVIVAIYVLVLGPTLAHFQAERRRLETHKHELSVAPDLREVARECLTLLQSGSLPKGIYEVEQAEDERLPPAIRSKHPRSVNVDAANQTVTIEFGGGSYHYGFLFKRRENTLWELFLYGEDPADCRELLLLSEQSASESRQSHE